jgi:hypothetical protein
VTVTLKLPFAVLLLLSVAVQFTVVEPIGNVEPDGGLQLVVGEPETASLAVAEYVTVLPADESASTVMFPGKLSVGFVVSWTVTLKDAEVLWPELSLAVHVTGVVPIAKSEPEGWSQLTLTLPLLSLAATEKLTLAPLPLVASAVMLPGVDVNVGLPMSETTTSNPACSVLVPSLASQPTCVVPIGKRLPDDGVHVAVIEPATASDALTSGHDTAAFAPAVDAVGLGKGSKTGLVVS